MAVGDFAVSTENQQPYVFEMKKTGEGKCIFLRKEEQQQQFSKCCCSSKENQCAVYQFRPLICRFYPFELTFDAAKGQYVFSATLECPAIGEGKVQSQKGFKRLFKLAKQRLL